MKRLFFLNQEAKQVTLFQLSWEKKENVKVEFDLANKVANSNRKLKRVDLERESNSFLEKETYALIRADLAIRLIKQAGLTPHCPAVQTSLMFNHKMFS